jgi:type I restriction enzyme R subunit
MRKTSTQIRALHPNLVLEFVQHTQPVQWKVITDYYGPRAATAFLDELTKALDSQGTLNVLRHGLDFFGQTFRLAYFAPATALNPETAKRFAANRLTITRQVRFSDKHEQSVDLLLSINGIPTATAELKNPFTGQTVKDAIQQYKDRDHREPLFTFKKRALVHFRRRSRPGLYDHAPRRRRDPLSPLQQRQPRRRGQS